MELKQNDFLKMMPNIQFFNNVRIEFNKNTQSNLLIMEGNSDCKLFWIQLWWNTIIPSYKNLHFYRKFTGIDITRPIYLSLNCSKQSFFIHRIPVSWESLYYCGSMINKLIFCVLPLFNSSSIYIAYILVIVLTVLRSLQ
ncbi:putative per os infectivity factor pif-6 [Chelonus insularis]|nr:putative per os infectivity factor pif-6 [Chelonus insularis]